MTFVATVDESRVLHLPSDTPLGEVEIVVREKHSKGSSAALLQAIQNLSPRSEEDVAFWREVREDLYRDRDAWDND